MDHALGCCVGHRNGFAEGLDGRVHIRRACNIVVNVSAFVQELAVRDAVAFVADILRLLSISSSF